MALSSRKPFNYAMIEKVSLSCPGVYVFWFNKVCIYVGKSDRPVKERLREHWTSCHNDELKKWIKALGSKLEFQWECLGEITKIRSKEQYYIDSFKPLTNKIDSETKL